ncbi:hypothetical protein [Streptomyces sp. SAS_276]|uniref:hypothetical protein n=1 Tax=Streptomyces sp. SAS_276 TaxID=3412745 RepID=UPI00403C2BB7
MSRDLFVKQVIINSTGGVRALDFAHPVVCVYGPIDTGKTTLVDCIKYPLGLPVEWRQVPSQRLTSGTVHLRIEGMDIALRRSTVTDTGTVELISPYDGTVEELLDVTPQPDGDRRVVGEVLLDLLGLSELFAPPTAVALLGSGARLTFAQLYALNHLSQDMVDGTEAVRGQANTAQSYKTVVELVLGLIDAEMRVLTARRDDLSQTVSQFKRRTETISEFLTGSAAGLEQELTRSQSEERDSLTALEELKGRMRAVTTFADPLRQRVAALEQAHSRAREEEKAAQAAVSLAQQAIKRAQQQPGTDPVLRCPSCTQPLTAGWSPTGPVLCACASWIPARGTGWCGQPKPPWPRHSSGPSRRPRQPVRPRMLSPRRERSWRSGPAWRSGRWPARSSSSRPPTPAGEHVPDRGDDRVSNGYQDPGGYRFLDPFSCPTAPVSWS